MSCSLLLALVAAPLAWADEPPVGEESVEGRGEEPVEMGRQGSGAEGGAVASPGPGALDQPLLPLQLPTPQDRLDEAVLKYQLGEHELARNLFAVLVNDQSIQDVQLRQLARFYLGEVIYYQGDRDGAREVFEMILADDPNYRPDPFRHPDDVRGWFETVRASTTTRLTPPALPPSVTTPPMSAVARMGFGFYQLDQGRTGVGTVLLLGQAATASATSLLQPAYMRARTYTAGDMEAEQRARRLRAAQWSTTGAFWLLYGWGWYDARHLWVELNPPGKAATSGAAEPGSLAVGFAF